MPQSIHPAPGPSETSVLIVGAGPVGLALACELGMRGIACVLVEQRDGTLHVPKMSLVSAGGMEFCRRWGIADLVRTAVWAESHTLDSVYMETLRGSELARVKIPVYAQKRPDWTPEGMCQCPQIYFDPILAARVARLEAVDVRYNTRLDAFDVDEHGVDVCLSDLSSGAQITIRARYLIGCDGASSAVREALGIPLSGEGGIADSINIFFRAPALASLHDKGWARIYRPIDDGGCWSELISIDGKELWRLTIFDDASYQQAPAAALRRMAGFDFPFEIISSLAWQRRDSVAMRYGCGRVWLAGDAVHQSSPTGGAGMHTGLEDAVNIAWKLQAMLEGWGGQRLIPSYEDERKPVAQRNVELSTITYRALRSIPKRCDAERETFWRTDGLSRYSIPDHVRSCPSYADFSICIDDGSPLLDRTPPAYVASTRPGARAPHYWIAPGRSTLDLFGDAFVLLRLGEAPPDGSRLLMAARARGVPVREIAIADPLVARLYERPLVLVRPDFHVAWRGKVVPDDGGSVIDRMRGA